ncbi:2,4-dienoyl-CoA reductase-like NADH-dependent reductase (Old Yellow Enzyme family) [Virgibacillus natechei]|uniref:2,4-dienoyl-CoA reductase-like NADH-dependent reductase (Old Yellow Enzyme family) n=1 Tax=Virgibacillus natechei TaxID=1216297 RepID=A0ABS4IIB1_9BACI|nr:hypothetical protein [Virgibacillus natechei]MBP1970667.1 2,4-dienoyl-CoA reductase-like NADH-dependent reductase (Old Yellow Enzyme family) [Virgibacillus natechei]UZD13949.1 hypothetical protein OLD84_05280 [Virgibacillus natechei]
MSKRKKKSQVILDQIQNYVELSSHTPDDATLVLEKGKTDFAAIGRAIVVDPHWVEKVEDNREETIRADIYTSNIFRSLFNE